MPVGALSDIGRDIRPAFERVGPLDALRAVVLSCEHASPNRSRAVRAGL
jgi:hypothetical protein